MKHYKVSKELYPFVRRILTRGYHKFSFEETDEGWLCITPISSDNFHKIIQRAKCEKKSRETGNFYVTAREHNNTLLLNALLEMGNQKSCIIIDDPEIKKIIL